ncbi:hypothetical protein U9M48_040601 [Paspalum notatum var. saurae]|uniref:Uncharacterized protein n=1 Tax=Paspalum notatum var. saurae TaxID=547442 RepID=A0AAQ3XDE1_PASNO
MPSGCGARVARLRCPRHASASRAARLPRPRRARLRPSAMPSPPGCPGESALILIRHRESLWDEKNLIIFIPLWLFHGIVALWRNRRFNTG